jgi:hypothetical protein
MKSRIHCETWLHYLGGYRSLGVLHEDPAVARAAFTKAGLTIQERILSSDGQRVWTLSRRQWKGRKAAKVSRPGQPANAAAI